MNRYYSLRTPHTLSYSFWEASSIFTASKLLNQMVWERFESIIGGWHETLNLLHVTGCLESLELLTNYVKNRTQCVRLGNSRSTTGKLTSGVPQGSLLGPHLFNIFINDLFYNIKKAKISAYADDKQLYFSNANARIVQETLNSELVVVSSWITDNGLLLNPEKCESLIFRRTNSKYNQTEEEKINFSVDGTLIEPSTTCKLLGVHIDKRLNFNNHVASICKKISKQIAVVSPFRKLLSIQTKLMLYKDYSWFALSRNKKIIRKPSTV